VLVYDEPFTLERLVGFGLVWSALLIYTIESIYVRRQRKRLAPLPGQA
jgi:chloramphenicol-sensitive protein RarD